MENCGDLAQTVEFVPIFRTKEAISEKLLDKDKKAARLVSKELQMPLAVALNPEPFAAFSRYRQAAKAVFPNRNKFLCL